MFSIYNLLHYQTILYYNPIGSNVLPAHGRAGARATFLFPKRYFSFCFRLRFHRSSKPKIFPPFFSKFRAPRFFQRKEKFSVLKVNRRLTRKQRAKIINPDFAESEFELFPTNTTFSNLAPVFVFAFSVSAFVSARKFQGILKSRASVRAEIRRNYMMVLFPALGGNGTRKKQIVGVALPFSKYMIKYFIYCRKSSEDEERQILSIEAQLTELREFARQNNLFVIREYHESKTAKEPGREIFNLMISEIEKGNAGGILAWNPDRLARNSIDGGQNNLPCGHGKDKSAKIPHFLV